MNLRSAYTLWAPIYDAVVDRATRAMRQASLARLPADGESFLLVGVGTGLDFPYLSPGPAYTGVDLTPAMLERAARRADRLGLSVDLREGNAMALPFADATFDHVVMHLIVAVVPEPARALAEAARVLRPGGQILVLDKFLPANRRAPLRRLLNALLSRMATRTDVVFDECLAACPGLDVVIDEPAIAGGWFRRIRLRKQD